MKDGVRLDKNQPGTSGISAESLGGDTGSIPSGPRIIYDIGVGISGK